LVNHYNYTEMHSQQNFQICGANNILLDGYECRERSMSGSHTPNRGVNELTAVILTIAIRFEWNSVHKSEHYANQCLWLSWKVT